MVAGFSEKASWKQAFQEIEVLPCWEAWFTGAYLLRLAIAEKKIRIWFLQLWEVWRAQSKVQCWATKNSEKPFHYDIYRISQGYRDSYVFVKRSATESHSIVTEKHTRSILSRIRKAICTPTHLLPPWEWSIPQYQRSLQKLGLWTTAPTCSKQIQPSCKACWILVFFLGSLKAWSGKTLSSAHGKKQRRKEQIQRAGEEK